MKSSKLLIVSLLALGSTLMTRAGEATPAPSAAGSVAAAPQFTGTAAIGYNSIYEFRGVDLGNDMVEASVSLATAYNGFGLSLSAWYATVNDDNNPTPNELDLTLGITKSLGPVNLSGGYIYYSFFEASETNTQELYLGASMEVIAGISASVTAYYDIDRYNGWYGDFNLSKTCKVSDSVSVVTTVGLGVADDHGLQLTDNGTLDGYQQFYAMVSVPWTIRPNVTLAPYLRYVNASSELVSDIPSNSMGQDHLIGGVKLSFAF
ncbi:MAG: hypothetical protein NTW21_23420 [Verrucomicrobia bacterium]|nr:hypothetical protein [Verrucomicrobiota bacterium]